RRDFEQNAKAPTAAFEDCAVETSVRAERDPGVGNFALCSIEHIYIAGGTRCLKPKNRPKVEGSSLRCPVKLSIPTLCHCDVQRIPRKTAAVEAVDLSD